MVSNFTLIWNFFEDTLCHKNANLSNFDDIAKAIALRDLPDGVKVGVRFWADRYRTGQKFNFLFEGLNFRQGDRRDLVEAVLSGAKSDAYSQLLAVMIIVYRLRNNLFHGTKTIPLLNQQVSNLDMACKALAAIMEA